MKKIIALLALSTFLMSCAHMYFTETQPRKSTRLMEIPAELQGFWGDETGSTEIHANGITIIEISEDTTGGGSEMVSETTYMDLSEDFQLYKSQDLYVFNLKESEGNYWEIGVLKRDENGDISYYTSNDPEDFRNDKRLKVVEAKYLDGEEERTFKKIQPESDLIMEHVVFSGQMDHKTVLNMLTEGNLVSIYRADGTVHTPEY